MKILILTGIDKIEKSDSEFVKRFGTTNYLRELTIHGLRQLYGYNVVDYPKSWGSYRKELEKRNFPKEDLWGQGFNYTGINEDTINIDRTDILSKIRKRYFDLIIFSDTFYSIDLLDEAKKFNNKIIILDGEDYSNINKNLLRYGVYFKRELIKKEFKNIFPISFSVPKEKILSKIEKNVKNILSPLLPGLGHTYIYKTEKDYNNMYQRSIFGITFKKAGWDCFRHYEILMNGCLPLFLDIKECPNLICKTLPKEKLIKLNSKYLNQIPKDFLFKLRFKKFPKFINSLLGLKKKIINEINSDDFLVKFPEILELKDEMLNFTKENLTTENAAKYIISTINNLNK